MRHTPMRPEVRRNVWYALLHDCAERGRCHSYEVGILTRRPRWERVARVAIAVLAVVGAMAGAVWLGR